MKVVFLPSQPKFPTLTFAYTLQDIDQAAQWLVQLFDHRKIMALSGDMGAGKTTLVSALCKLLGTKDLVASPTYAIIHEYQTKEKCLYHMDWYRLEDEQEAIEAGVEDALYSGCICLVEWPEKAAGLLPDDTLYVTIRNIAATERILEVA